MFREQGVTSAIPPFTIMYGWRWGSSFLKYLTPSQARWRISLGLIFRTLSSVLMPKLSLTLKTESCLTFHFLNTWQSLSKPKVTILLGLSGTQAEQLHFLCKTSRQIFRIVWPTLLIVSVRSSLSRLSWVVTQHDTSPLLSIIRKERIMEVLCPPASWRGGLIAIS